MKTNYVLIDYENVQPANLSMLKGEQFKVIVFVGARQKLDVSIVAALQSMGERVQYIQISGTGKNAADFHIACTLGQLLVKEPDAFFHIISKDQGFDPLITYSKNNHIQICRSDDIPQMPCIKPFLSVTVNERLDLAIDKLKQMSANKPGKKDTLRNAINNFFSKGLSEIELDGLVNALVEKGYVRINDSKVSYPRFNQ